MYDVDVNEGDRVEGGDPAAGFDGGHDTGRVIEVDGDRALVAWDGGGCILPAPLAGLRVIGRGMP